MNINNEEILSTGWPGKNNVLIKCIFILLQILQKESMVHSVAIYLYPQICSCFFRNIGILWDPFSRGTLRAKCHCWVIMQFGNFKLKLFAKLLDRLDLIKVGSKNIGIPNSHTRRIRDKSSSHRQLDFPLVPLWLPFLVLLFSQLPFLASCKSSGRLSGRAGVMLSAATES